MSAVEIATAYISIVPTMVNLESNLNSALAPAEAAATRAGVKAGEGFSKSFSGAMKNASVAVSELGTVTSKVTAPLVEIQSQAIKSAAGMDKLAASAKPVAVAVAGISDNAKVMSTSISSATGASGTSFAALTERIKLMSVELGASTQPGISALDRLQAAAQLAGTQATTAMDKYRAATLAAADADLPAIAAVDKFGAAATLAAAKAEDAMRVYAAAAATAGAEAGAGLSKGVETGMVESEGRFAKATESMKTLAGGLVAGLAVGGALEFFKEASKAATDDALAVRMVKGEYGDASESVLKFSENAANAYGMSAGAANMAAAKMGQFLGAMGITGQTAADLSTKVIGLSADIGKFVNADPASVESAIQGALKGRGAAMAQFGVHITTATVQEEALTEGLIKQGQKMTDTQRATATLNLIIKDTANEQGAFSKSSNELGTSQQILKANMEDLAAKAGAALIPFLQTVSSLAVHVLLPAFQGILGVMQPIISGFSNLPGPVRDTAAALGLLLLIKGPLSTLSLGVRNFINDVGTIKATAAESGESISTLGATAERSSGMMASLGKMIGTAGVLMGATYIFDSISATSEHLKSIQDDLTASTKTLTDSIVAEGGKWDDVTKAALTATVTGSANFQELIAKGGNYGDVMDLVTGKTKSAGKVLSELNFKGASADDVIGLTQYVSKLSSIAPTAQTNAAAVKAYNDQQTKTAASAAAITAGQDARTSSLTNQATAQYAVVAAQKAMNAAANQPGASAAATASEDYARSLTVQQDAMSKASDAINPFQQALTAVSNAASAATTQDSLFMDGLDALAGKSISATQAANTDAAAMRGIGAAARQHAADLQALATKEAAYTVALAGHLGTQADADAANAKSAQAADTLAKAEAALVKAQNSGKTTATQLAAAQGSVTLAQQKADKAAQDAATAVANVGKQVKGSAAYYDALATATRDVAAAKDTLATSSDAEFTANKAAADAARVVVKTTMDQSLVTKGMTGAISDATKAMQSQRDQFIKNVEGAGLSEKAAKALADQEGLIPKGVTTTFTAEIADAQAKGDYLYRSYNKTTGNWTAEFLTQNDAAAKAKAGDILQAYNATANTFTGTLDVNGVPALSGAQIVGRALAATATAKYEAQLTAVDVDALAKSNAVQTAADSAAAQRVLTIDGNDRASSMISVVQANLNAMQDKTVTLTVNSVGQSVTATTAGTAANPIFRTGSGALLQAEGGHIKGPGTGTSDSIPAWLSNGEFVVKASQTAKYRGLLESINNGYASGGFVQGHVNATETGPGAGPAIAALNALYGRADSAAAASAAAAKAAAVVPTSSSAGVEQWRALADSVFAAKGVPLQYVQTLLNQMNQESSGNPAAINLTDSNAQAGHPSVGLLQFIPSTFAANADPGFNTNIYDPASQFHAFINYINGTYGGMAAFTAQQTARNWGAYAAGGSVHGPGTGTSDSINARLSNGEFVVNAGAAARNAALLQSINGGNGNGGPGFARGGSVGGGPINVNSLDGALPQVFVDRLDRVMQGILGLQVIVSNARATAVADQAKAVVSQAALLAAQKAASASVEASARKLQGIQLSSANAIATAQAKVVAAMAIQDAETRKTTAKQAAADQARVLAAQRSLTYTQQTQQARLQNAAVGAGAAGVRLARQEKLTASAVALAAAADRAASNAAKLTGSWGLQEQMLKNLAHTYDRTTNQINAQAANIAAMQSAKSQTATSVSSAAQGFGGGLTGFSAQRGTFAAILQGQQYDLSHIVAIEKMAKSLAAKGLNGSAINDAVTAAEGGNSTTLLALNGATKAQIGQLNYVTGQIKGWANATGSTVASSMYDAGIKAGDGILAGLKTRDAALNAHMVALAKSMALAMKNALGIKSPSTVFHNEVGIPIAAGIISGMASQSSAVARGAANLVKVPSVAGVHPAHAGSDYRAMADAVREAMDGASMNLNLDNQVLAKAVLVGNQQRSRR